MITIQAQALSEMSLYCGSDNVFPVAEEQLSYVWLASIDKSDHVIAKKPLVYCSDFTKNRKVFFLANR